jgi:hypothetical protein
VSRKRRRPCHGLGGQNVRLGSYVRFERDAKGQPGEQPILMAVHQTYSSVRLRCYFPMTFGIRVPGCRGGTR